MFLCVFFGVSPWLGADEGGDMRVAVAIVCVCVCVCVMEKKDR